MEDHAGGSFAVPASTFHRFFNRKIVWLIVVNLVLVLAIGSGVWVLVQNSRKTLPKPQTQQALHQSPQATGSAQPELPVIDPNSNTANRYFSGDSNAIDFRKDGSKGDFTIGMEKKDGKVVLDWDKSLKVTGVTVYDVGRLDILTDHIVAFATSFIEPKPLVLASGNPQPLPATAAAKPQKPMPVPTITPPTTFISSPYTVGTIAQGYFNTTPSTNPNQSEAQINADSLFKPGKRYSIEVYALAPDNKQQMASYTFTY